MTRTLLIFFMIQFIFPFTSCEDSLTILPPDGQVKGEYWKKKEDVEATLMGAYQQFAQMDERLFYFGELRGDLLADGGNLSNRLRNIMESNIFPSNNWVNWQPFYSVINYCNLVLKYAPQVKKSDRTFSDFKYRAYISEATFLRSLAYFYLVRIYKDVPFVLAPYDTDNQDFFPRKTEDYVILDSLDTQLNRILSSIPKSYETHTQTRGRATRGAVNALLADIALWRFDYQACIDYVEQVENNELYELVPAGEWFTIFSRGNTLEGIFELQFDSDLGQNNNMFGVTRPQNNNFLASSYLAELLSPEKSKEIIRGNGSMNIYDKTIWKYIGSEPDGVSQRSGTERRSCNWVVYRLAGVLLMKAEALSQMGRFDEALTIINRLRERALVAPLGSHQQTAQAFEDLILEERAKELAFEGKRWFDLLRMGRRNNYERKATLIELIIRNAPATQKRVLASKLNDTNGWYFPIYDGEIENNPNLRQNPYYQIYE